MKKNDTLITVVLPCYNATNYIKETLDSLLNQTYKNLQIICIDDFSTDNTYQVLQTYSKYDNIQIYENEKNLGVTETLNRLISLVKTEWVLRMDSDDIYDVNRVEKMINFAINNNLDVVSTDYRFIDEDNNPNNTIKTLDLCTLDGSIRFMSLLNSPMPSQALFKTSLLKQNPFDKSYIVSEDYQLFSKLLRLNDVKVGNINNKLYQYCINTSGLSKTKSQIMALNHFKIAKTNTNYFIPENNSDLLYLEIALDLKKSSSFNASKNIKIFKEFNAIKNSFINKNKLTKKEIEEIVIYHDQYFFFLLKKVIKSKRNLIFSISFLNYIIPKTIARLLKFKNLKWILKNL